MPFSERQAARLPRRDPFRYPGAATSAQQRGADAGSLIAVSAIRSTPLAGALPDRRQAKSPAWRSLAPAMRLTSARSRKIRFQEGAMPAPKRPTAIRAPGICEPRRYARSASRENRCTLRYYWTGTYRTSSSCAGRRPRTWKQIPWAALRRACWPRPIFAGRSGSSSRASTTRPSSNHTHGACTGKDGWCP